MVRRSVKPPRGSVVQFALGAGLGLILADARTHRHQRHKHRHSRHKVRGATPPWKSFCTPGNGWEAEWADEFDGDVLNSTSWQVVTTQSSDDSQGVSAPVAGLGVTACRTAKCRADNVRVHGGQLHLLSERDQMNRYFTGAVTTKGHRAWKDDQPYRLCVSAKLPGGGGLGHGIWPAHWMLPDNGVSDKCLDEGEMDIMEMINGDGGSYSTFHWMSSWPQQKCANFDQFHKSKARQWRMPHDWSEAFHEYAVERSADTIHFAIDGEVVNTIDASEIGSELSHSPFFLILNTAVGGGWPGEPTSNTKLPTEHAIDYVRVVRKAGKGTGSEQPHASWLRREDTSAPLQPSSFVQISTGSSSEGPPPLSLADVRPGLGPSLRSST